MSVASVSHLILYIYIYIIHINQGTTHHGGKTRHLAALVSHNLDMRLPLHHRPILKVQSLSHQYHGGAKLVILTWMAQVML